MASNVYDMDKIWVDHRTVWASYFDGVSYERQSFDQIVLIRTQFQTLYQISFIENVFLVLHYYHWSLLVGGGAEFVWFVDLNKLISGL